MKQKIIIAGGTGFLGHALEQHFTAATYEVLILTRKPTKPNHIAWDGCSLGSWTDELEGAEAIINLCGKSVDCRYTPANKKAILDSRLIPTAVLDAAIELCTAKPKIFLNASSATIYVHAEQQLMDERTGIIGDDFSMNVVKQWEACFFKQEIEQVRKVALRSSIVLGENGGAFPKLKMITKLGLGGRQGNGTQMVSWISERDFCRAIEYILHNKHLEGPINLTAPEPVTNKYFMEIIREQLRPMFYFNQPKFLLELGAILMRTETELLLKSRNVIPARLLKSGFHFECNTIEEYLNLE